MAGKMFDFKGVMAPTMTPMHPDGSLNLDLIPRYAQYLHANGVRGVFVNGTLGEGFWLTVEERKRVVEAWAIHSAMVPTMVVHVGGASLRDTQDMVRHAVAAGAASIATLPPLYDKPPTLDSLLEYLQEVASAAPETPLLYYHFPAQTNVNFPMDELLLRGKKMVPTLAGMKFTSPAKSAEAARVAQVPGTCVLTGFDQDLSHSRAMGFPGVINGSFNMVPLEAGRLFCLADKNCTCPMSEEKRRQEVADLQSKIDLLWAAIIKHGGTGCAGAKAAMRLITGMNLGAARRPHPQLSSETTAMLAQDLTKAGFILSIPENST